MIMAKNPCECWTEERVRGYIGKGKTLKGILKIKDVPAVDRIWCITRFLPAKTNRGFAIWNAEQCEIYVQEIKDYIKVIKRYDSDKSTNEKLTAAYAFYAAYSAAYAAADRAAMLKKQIKKLLSMI